MIFCYERWFEEVLTHKGNVEIDFSKSCRKCRVCETNDCAEEILNLVLVIVFPLKYLLLLQL